MKYPNRRRIRRIYPEEKRKADLTPIHPTPATTGDGHICNPERIVPGLRQVKDLDGAKERRLELETFAHFALNAGQGEADLVAPVALGLRKGHQLLLSKELRDDLRVVELQEISHEERYGDSVLIFVEAELGYAPATLKTTVPLPPCSSPISIEDIARYVVAEATASGTLFGDHGPLCTYSQHVIEGHRQDELPHNAVALEVNIELLSQSSGSLLDHYIDALAAAIESFTRPSRPWVNEVVHRLGYRGVEADRLVDQIVLDEANVDAVLASCEALFKTIKDESPAAWSRLSAGLAFDALR